MFIFYYNAKTRYIKLYQNKDEKVCLMDKKLPV